MIPEQTATFLISAGTGLILVGVFSLLLGFFLPKEPRTTIAGVSDSYHGDLYIAPEFIGSKAAGSYLLYRDKEHAQLVGRLTLVSE